jgi:cytochrome c peroxidase
MHSTPLLSMLAAALILPVCAAAQEFRLRVPLGLDERALIIPEDNPMTAEKIGLGRQLFFDPRWSKRRAVSCSSCHAPDKGWSDDRPHSTDHEGKPTARHSPTLVNRAFGRLEGWAGHRESTEELLLRLPFTSTETIAQNLAPISGYQAQFERVFGSGVTAEAVAKAIAAFQRSILSGNSAYDRFKTGNDAALSPAAMRGLALFEGKARCANCHSGFNFSDDGYHNIGIGMDKANPDLGRYLVTTRQVNRGAFKTPTLRDVALRRPYMHDGSIATLHDVVTLYDRGGIPNPSLSPEIRRLDLNRSEQEDLVAFLESLSGEISTEVGARPTLPE